jgi:hypothetical protein
VFDARARRFRISEQRIGVRVAYLISVGLRAYVNQLRARRQHTDARSRADLHPRVTERGERGHRSRIDRLARAQDDFAARDLRRAFRDELRRRRRSLNFDRRAVLCFARHFDLLDAVRACGHRRARHDAHGLARLQLSAPARARRSLSDYRQTHGRTRLRAFRVRRAHRVAVHQRAIKRRQVCVGDNVFGQHTTARLRKRNRLRRQARRLGFNDTNGFGNWNHTSDANKNLRVRKAKAVVS